jgi:hypothetical protein
MRFRFDTHRDSFRAPFSPDANMDELRDIESFLTHASALEARIAAAEAAGDDVPPEARIMLASLRDLAQAVDGLRTTITETSASGPAPGAAPGALPPDSEDR